MIGYGPEDDHFVIELTYNYGVKSYVLGTRFSRDSYLILSKKMLFKFRKRLRWHNNTFEGSD